MSSYKVHPNHEPKACGPYEHYMHFDYSGHPSGCRIMRDPDEVRAALAAGIAVYFATTTCDFCGGPAPCLRH